MGIKRKKNKKQKKLKSKQLVGNVIVRAPEAKKKN